jgi:hypothetical protein
MVASSRIWMRRDREGIPDHSRSEIRFNAEGRLFLKQLSQAGTCGGARTPSPAEEKAGADNSL